jgi:hypothetical protein
VIPSEVGDVKFKSRVLLLVLAAAAMAAMVACEDPSAIASQDGGTTPGTTSPVPKQSVLDPYVREAASAYPGLDNGHTVHITNAGIQPRALTSLCCDPVVFKNETGAPISVTFNISKATSGPIAAGGSWSWTPPNPESVIYHLGTDLTKKGQIQVESPNW